MTDKYNAYTDTEERLIRFLAEGDIRSHYVRIIRFCSSCNEQISEGERCDPCQELWAESEAELDAYAEAERRYKDSDAWDRDIEEHER